MTGPFREHPSDTPHSAGTIESDRSPERIVFFTDAAVAIALTLLVLPLSELVPELVTEQRPAIEAITHNQWKIFSFLLSFIVIAKLWFEHHRLFEQVRAYNGPLVVMNFCWVLTIVILPFPTEIAGAYSNDRFSVLFYVGTILASTACQCALTMIVRLNPETASSSSAISDRWMINSLASTSVLAIAFVVAVLWPNLGYYALLLLMIPSHFARWVTK
ncbi:TMEM175 family protein [Pseudonocardia spinosispora]|uniref:TMEM175 family protein n=1 Tax=Pseudonocardia spinosispora TaxID=103441 RepID=UPI001FE04711|nr:TMEM175 family protein [Pseudonocardia spinosispora]